MSYMEVYELEKAAKDNTKAWAHLTRWMVMPFTERGWKKFGGKIMSLSAFRCVEFDAFGVSKRRYLIVGNIGLEFRRRVCALLPLCRSGQACEEDGGVAAEVGGELEECVITAVKGTECF